MFQEQFLGENNKENQRRLNIYNMGNHNKGSRMQLDRQKDVNKA